MGNEDNRFGKILNLPIINITNKNGKKYIFTILQLLCANQLGIVMEFIINRMNSYDIFNIQDDDGNTPLHLLCKNVNNLIYFYKSIYDNFSYGYFYNHTNKSFTDHVCYFSNFSSRPILSQSIDLILHISNYVEFSIKNKDGKTADELTNNHLIREYYCKQLFNKRDGKFPSKLNNYDNEYFDEYFDESIENELKVLFNLKDSKINNNDNECLYEYFEESIENEWKVLFNLKDSKRNNKTFLHFLCEGDRFNAIQFIVEHGADINYNTSAEEKSQITRKRFSNTNSNSLNEYMHFQIYNNMHVTNKSLFSFLFCYYDKYYYPSGFVYYRRIDSLYKISSLKNFIKGKLNKREQYIMNETEKIAEYLFDRGAKIILEENLNFYLISDIIYKLLKKKENTVSGDNKNKQNEKNTIIDLELELKDNKNHKNENNTIIDFELETKEKDNFQSNQSNKDEASTSQLSENKKLLSQNEFENKEITNSKSKNINLPDSILKDLIKLSELPEKLVENLYKELLSNMDEKLEKALKKRKLSNQ